MDSMGEWDDPPSRHEFATEAGGVLTMLLSFSVWHHSEVWRLAVGFHGYGCMDFNVKIKVAHVIVR